MKALLYIALAIVVFFIWAGATSEPDNMQYYMTNGKALQDIEAQKKHDALVRAIREAAK